MSLINQMLQDLEKRGTENETQTMPQGVTSARPEHRNRLPLIVIAGITVLSAGLLAYFYIGKSAVVSPQVLAVVSPTTNETPESVTPLSESKPPVPKQQVMESTPPLPSAKLVNWSGNKVAKKEKKKKVQELAKERAKAKESLAANPKSHTAKIDKTPVQTEAQEMAEALYRQAANSFSLGRSNESIEKLRHALALDSAHSSARQLLTKLLLEQQAYDEARGLLREGVRQQPSQLQWASILARLELERGDANAARKALDASAGFAANSADFQSLAGAVAQRQGKPDDAADFYRNALRIKPSDGRSWVGLGMSLEAEGHAPEAREAFRRALSTENLSAELKALAERKSR